MQHTYKTIRHLKRAVVLTALDTEYKAVKAHLKNIHSPADAPSDYEVGTFRANGVTWDIYVKETGQGNLNAQHFTEEAVKAFTPDYIFFAGIAGGIKDVKVGDVVISSKIYGYESGADNGSFSARPDTVTPNFDLLEHATKVKRTRTWRKSSKSFHNNEPKLFIGAIAAGEKIPKSLSSETVVRIKRSFNDALAVEKEGFGFGQVAQWVRELYLIVFRGISDLLAGKSESEALGSHEVAAHNAAAVLFDFLGSLSKSFLSEEPEFINVLCDTHFLGPGVPPSIRRIGTLNYKLTLNICDKTGSLVQCEKNAVEIIERKKARTAVDFIGTDGRIQSISTTPGQVEIIAQLTQSRYMIITRYPRTLKKKDTINRKLCYELVNSFMNAKEFWRVNQPLAYNFMEFLIKFPKDRPCKEGITIIYDLSTRKKMGESPTTLSKDGRKLESRIDKPSSSYYYEIRWSW